MNTRCMGCMETFSEEYDICPHCGYVVGTPVDEAIHMEAGTLLHDRYIVGKVLGFGGFGVTYIGWDGKLEQKVAIKEYLPSEFSTRMPGQSLVTVFSGERSEQFNDGLNKFIEEAKRLAKFQNEPGIVKIFDSFVENGTAYIIMEYLDGETLTEKLKREKRIPEDEAVKMIWPILESLEIVHEEGIIHRDIAPDNIFITKDGEVKLIDFGASRFATTSHSRSLTVIIKPGFSPEEQYRSRGDQGPHTDVYAIAAVLYKMITGKTPPDAMERRAKIETQKKDILEEPHKIIKEISETRENAILNAMNIQIEDRTADIQTFKQEINANPPAQRRYGKIKKIDFFRWPLWVKIVVPTVLVVLIAFAVLLFTNVISFHSLFSGEVVVPDKMVIVPDVEGMDKDEAFKTLEDMKILAITAGSVESKYIEAGKIVLQDPGAGNYVYEYGTVNLTVSSGEGVQGPVNGISTVPYVIWDTKEDAISKMLQAGLAEPKIIEKHDSQVAAGRVISQDPKAGKKIKERTQTTITISKGPESFKVPKVINQAEATACQLLRDFGLVINISYQKSTTVEAGKIISQSLKAGSTAKGGDKIAIVVSTGKEAEKVHVHEYVSRITQEPSVGKEGTVVYTCATCGDSYTEKISAYSLSDWVLASQAPKNADVIERKWVYNQTSYTTSSSSSLSGWTQYDSSFQWVYAGSGVYEWANFPSGYNQNDQYYYNLAKYEGSTWEDATTRRKYFDSQLAGYIYWHWCPGIDKGSGNFLVGEYEGESLAYGNAYTWHSFWSATQLDNGGYENLGKYQWYCPYSMWFIKLPYYKQTYEDYVKSYTYYYKKVDRLESSVKPSGNNISIIGEYVKYIIK